MNWFLDVFAEDERGMVRSFTEEDAPYEQALREGICEDDCEATTNVGMMPAESNHEKVSPLRFKGD
jgi:hypothetical protein